MEHRIYYFSVLSENTIGLENRVNPDAKTTQYGLIGYIAMDVKKVKYSSSV